MAGGVGGRGVDPVECAKKLVGPTNRSDFDKFANAARGLEGEITERRLNVRDFGSVQALADSPTVLDEVKALTKHEAYDGNNPNVVRALVNTFAGANPAAFHRSDGAGYEFIADQVIDIDARNSQLAARLAGSFNAWRRHDEGRQALMRAQLERIQKEATSKDTLEIVGRALA